MPLTETNPMSLTVINDRALRAQLVADIRRRADVWKLQATKAYALAESYACRARAAVLEQLAHDLESGRT